MPTILACDGRPIALTRENIRAGDEAIWPHRSERGPEVEGTGAGEHGTEEDAGGGDAQEPGVVIRMRKKSCEPSVSPGVCANSRQSWLRP